MKQKVSRMVDIKEWEELAWKHANTSDKKDLQGVELDDLYQCAMIGIYEASLKYDGDKGGFPQYAYWYIQKEINNMVYRRVMIDGERGRLPKIMEELYADLPEQGEADIEECEQLSYDPIDDDLIWADKYISSLPLKGIELDFFNNLINLGDKEATRIYVETTGHTRQRAYQVRDKVRDVAERHSRRMN